VVNFFLLVAEGVRRNLARLGARTLEEIVGKVEHLRQRADVGHWKAQRIDLSSLLAIPPRGPRHCRSAQKKDISDHFDHRLIGAQPVGALKVNNSHRAVGAMLSGDLVRKHGPGGLSDDAMHVKLQGTAGQSFGAFLTRGVTLELEGEANDYVGKGLSGGRIVVYPPRASSFVPEENVIVGNTVLYGATSGEAYFSGVAGERFAVRNSGARAVVEGVGDHGCEYMTGGAVVVLGTTGRNFAAGMSGGTAYVFDRARTFKQRCNTEMVELESLVDESEIWLVYGLIETHLKLTESPLARRILDNWEHLVSAFVKVMPTDYRKVLQARRSTSLRPPTEARLKLVVGREG
jgi:glutamate synthase (NADPH/NADH) large chain